MNKTRIGLLVATTLLAYPTYALAQEGEEPAEEGEAAEGEGAEGEAAEGEGEGELPEGEELPGEGEGLGDICEIDPAACPELDLNKEAAKPLREQIYAVQQIYALRLKRPSPRRYATALPSPWEW